MVGMLGWRGGNGGGKVDWRRRSGGGVSSCRVEIEWTERIEDFRLRFLGVGCAGFSAGTSNGSEMISAVPVAVFRSSAPDGGIGVCSSEREYVDIGVGGLSPLLLERETAVSSECTLRWPVSNHLPESTRWKSGLAGGLPSSGLSSWFGYAASLFPEWPLLWKVPKSMLPPPETRENITRPRQSRRRMDCTIDIRFWNTTSSARMLSRVLIAKISRRDSSRWLSRDITVLCQISSYCCLNPRSSSRTVLFRVSRKVVVFCNCFFSTLMNASRRILDCSSMYFRERVEFVSRSWRRRDTALKKDSWIVGRAEAEEEVLLVLFLTELVML
jgi:hypothetical protein